MQWLKNFIFPKYEFLDLTYREEQEKAIANAMAEFDKTRQEAVKRRIRKRLKSRDYSNVFRKRYHPALNFWREEYHADIR